MMTKFIQPRSTFLLFCQTFRNKVLQFLTPIDIVRNRNFLLQYYMQIEFTPYFERHPSYYQLISQQSQRPNVNTRIMPFLLDDLRWVVQRSTTCWFSHSTSPALSCPTKIANLDNTLYKTQLTNWSRRFSGLISLWINP